MQLFYHYFKISENKKTSRKNQLAILLQSIIKTN